jgi:hypothetical protein
VFFYDPGATVMRAGATDSGQWDVKPYRPVNLIEGGAIASS